MWNVTSKKKKGIIRCVIILLVFLGGIVMMGIQTEYVFYTTYCKDYYPVLMNTESLKYDNILDANGEPDKTTREEYTEYGDCLIYHEYADGRLFVFADYGNNNPSLCRIDVTNPEYRFGRKGIGIGTDKSTIEKVYRKSYQGLQKDTLKDYYFAEDGNFLIYFYFDENDKVCKISIGEAEIFHGVRGWKRK